MKPSLNLLKEGVSADAEREVSYLAETCKKIISLIRGLGITKFLGHDVRRGPSTSRLELKIDPSTNMDKLKKSTDNFCLLLGTSNVRVMTPVPERPFIGVEFPNETRDVPTLRTILEKASTDMEIPVALGFDSSYNPIVEDLTKAPHILVAGATGSGKSVCVNTMINTILFTKTAEEVRFLMVDPKMVELSVYNNIPHLIGKVATTSEEAKKVLSSAVAEMEKRYKMLTKVGARNIKSYCKMTGEKLPYIVLIVDEYADLMAVAKKEVEESVSRLAAMSRAVGIHIILATQRPSTDVVTGVIKNNFPTRIAFRVASSIDSRTIIDTRGAERLLGKGDMLYLKPGAEMTRIQGTYLSDEEVSDVVKYLSRFKVAEPTPVNDDILSEFSEEELHSVYEDMLLTYKANYGFVMTNLNITDVNKGIAVFEAMCAKWPHLMRVRNEVYDMIRSGRILI